MSDGNIGSRRSVVSNGIQKVSLMAVCQCQRCLWLGVVQQPVGIVADHQLSSLADKQHAVGSIEFDTRVDIVGIRF